MMEDAPTPDAGMNPARRRACWVRPVAAAALAVFGLLTGGLAVASATAADYASAPRFSSFVASPASDQAAFLMRMDNGRVAAAVIDLADPKKLRVVASYRDADVTRVAWVNDRRLIYEAYEPGPVIDRDGAGTFAVDVAGGEPELLINWQADNETTGTRLKRRLLNLGWFFYRTLDDGSDDVLVVRRDLDPAGWSKARTIARLNTRTGAVRLLAADKDVPRRIEAWRFDPKGELRVVQTNEGETTALHWRSPAPGADAEPTWMKLEEHPRFSEQGMEPLYIESDGTAIVATARNRDTTALYAYDPVKRQLATEPLAAVDGFDVHGPLQVDRQAGRVVGVTVALDRAVTAWFDARLAGIQATVDAALPPGRTNVLECGRCLSARYFVVRSFSDRQPGQYFIYDHERRALTKLGDTRPWLPEASQGRRSFHRVPARDGLPLPVVVTHPPDAGDTPLPAVVLVHGGPWVRGADLGWDAEAQFLASRGYRVIEVDFRGSTGLGSRHFKAGWKQWGQAMQDDLVDALDWAIGRQWVDRERTCIYGGSYGGYAALMGPVSHPGRFRCAVSFAGVTDLSLMFNDGWSDITDDTRKHGYPVLIGDPARDAELLRRHSPVNRVRDMKAPVLLVHGLVDRRVTIENADRFEKAAREAGVDLERVDYPHVAHGFHDRTQLADFLDRLGRFVDKHLKPAPAR